MKTQKRQQVIRNNGDTQGLIGKGNHVEGW